jgi:uncharacterized protein (TIGR02453 family)
MFTPAAFDFLRQLQANNTREWFEPRKAQFQELCRDPALRLIEALAEPLAAISTQFVASSKPVGGSLFRIHRDVRFARDKTPYKPWLGMRFKHVSDRSGALAPLFYVHLGAQQCFAGGGLWHPDAPMLTRVRNFIAHNPQSMQDLLAAPTFQTYRLGGESAVRPPRGFDPAHPLIEMLKRKDFVAMRDFDPSVACSAQVVDFISEYLRGAAGLVDYLCAALDLEF